ncbi:DUF3180 domain-containing protein [Nocardiopsis sp. NRRL B-16309]|uniref:DUF3180 domain-containing protein n=1 Tax=Nocardiopsis sp. NRRL B-16309 TaxID=1519494 RepID=UPI0006AED7BD|nr:DUF3180 domain-containing protein [Nocardiopsis sp. NRRL B-16309]KOX16439.1 hypothetical protein ADL05_11890 [Nocardiopsis sp. NRRL B-16309]
MAGEDEHRLRPTGWRVPAVLIAAGALLGVLLTNSLPFLPVLPWSGIPTLLLLALAEGFTAGRTRRRIQRVPGTEPMEPLSAARLLALAKASALFASLTAGFFLGMAFAVSDTLELPSPREVFFTALGTGVASAALLASALYLEYACRVPEDEDDPDDPRGSA